MRYDLGRFRRPMRRSTEGQLASLVGLGDGSTLSLDFTAMSSLDSRFTFTRASTATYINSSGLVTTMAAASTNDPTKARFDHDPTTLAPRGLLIEGSATNLLNWSESFATTGGTNNNWADTNITRNSTNNTDPANGTTALRITASAGNGTIISSAAMGTSARRTFSIWLRRVSGTGNIQYTLDNGSTYTTQAITSSWVRYTFAATTAAQQVGIRIVTSGDAIELWGAQLEVTGSGTGASSYIPTGASTVQRAADSCSIALSSFGFNTTGGTFFADWYRKEYDASSTGSGGPWNTDYAPARWLGVQTTSASNAVFLGSWSGATSISNGATRNKAAATYGSWGGSTVPITFCVNKSAVSSGTRDFNPANPTRLMIGAASESSPYTTASRDFLNNSIRSIKYWPSILPDATLQSLTQ